MIVNRLEERSKTSIEESVKVFNSTYEVIEKTATEVIQKHKELISDITLSKVSKQALEPVIIKIMNKRNYKVEGTTRQELIKAVMDHILGYGPLQPYLDMEECSGIFGNSPDSIWAKIGNKMIKTNINFGTVENMRAYIRTTIQANLKGELNEDKALAKFEDPINKLRIVCAIEPVSHLSPTFVFRKHKKEAFSLTDLIEMGMLTVELAEELKRYTHAGANFIFCGRGGSGKTTLMRALLEEIDPQLRMLVMEEHPELQLKHPNAVQYLVKRNTKGEVYGIEEISDMGLLMTIDMYVFGEIRDAEAMSFYNGAYAGNISWSTGHAGSARKILKKMVINMKKSGCDLSDESLLNMLYESINIIIFMDKFTIGEVVEVVEEGKIEEKYNTLWKKENHQIEKIKSTDMLSKLKEKNLLKEGDGKIATNISNNIVSIDRAVSCGKSDRP